MNNSSEVNDHGVQQAAVRPSDIRTNLRHSDLKTLLVIAVLGMSLMGTNAEASRVTYAFTGTVISIDPSLSGTFDNSMILSGVFTYESSTPGSLFGSENSGFSNYGALTNLVVTVGSYTASPPFGADLFSGMQVINNWFGISGFNATSRLTGAPFNGFNPIIGLFFTTHDQVFSNTQLADVGDLTGWSNLHPGGVWYMAFDCCGGSPRVLGVLTSLVLVPTSDTTPPILTFPAPITVDATGPSGAVVTYAVSASDPDDLAGPVTCSPASGSTLPIGATTVACSSTDTHGNTGYAAFTVTVRYDVCLLYDDSKTYKLGSTIPIKFQLCTATGGDLSSSNAIVTSTNLVYVSTNTSDTVQDAGNANPDSNFRYEATLGSTGGYIFNLQTKGLTSGTWALHFKAGGDPTDHVAYFKVN